MIPRDLSKVMRRELASGQTFDQSLAALRSAGASMIECIVTVRSVRQYSLSEAKQWVHDSLAWADVRPAMDEFHSNLAAELGREFQADADNGTAPV